MKVLIDKGYVELGQHSAVLVYLPTVNAVRALKLLDNLETGKKPTPESLRALQIDESAVGKKPALFSYKHLLLCATFGIEAELGENVSALTGGLLPNLPQVVITELEIQQSEKTHDEKDLWANWKSDCQAMLQPEHVTGYPSLDYGVTVPELEDYLTKLDQASAFENFVDDIGRYLGEVRETIERFWFGRRITQVDAGQIPMAHLFHTMSHDLKTTQVKNNKTITKDTERTPDLVVALPNIVHEDGTITGGSYGVEFELNPKDMARNLPILLNLWHNPLLAGVLVITDNPQVVTKWKKALRILADGPHSPFTFEQAEKYFHFLPPYLLNSDLDATGLLA